MADFLFHSPGSFARQVIRTLFCLRDDTLEPVVDHAVQIPGSGQPIIMLVDRQTTGGYPKIATVITPDVRLLMRRDRVTNVAGDAVSALDPLTSPQMLHHHLGGAINLATMSPLLL